MKLSLICTVCVQMIAEELEVELEYKRKEKEGDDKPSKENKESVIGEWGT